jgi:hypothetical protein
MVREVRDPRGRDARGEALDDLDAFPDPPGPPPRERGRKPSATEGQKPGEWHESEAARATLATGLPRED